MPRRRVKAFIPGKAFPSVSITGSRCWLNCRYCMGRYLGQMEHVDTPEKLYWYARQVKKNGGIGLLISGGFTSDGKLPYRAFLPSIKRIKKELGLILSIHPGLVSREEAAELREAGIDIVDYEIILDVQTIRGVLNLHRSTDDFIRTYEYLVEDGPPYIAPHILVGAKHGIISWEYRAVELLSQYKPYIIVFLALIPTKYTPMYGIPMPRTDEFINLLKHARRYQWIISVGCMRPRSFRTRIDPIIIDKELADRIVLPRKDYITMYDLKTVYSCCSVPDELLEETIGIR
ncbi:MAG: radical SAM protein [Crenarchaeota archaeon]|nr:radical SAM protein [Thermoproteota archaeon]